MKFNSKQITIGVLIFLIVALGIFILIISTRISNSTQAPTSTKAGVITGKDAPGDAGQPCSSNLDCKTPANGAQSVCTGSICQNAICIGKTIPGANYDCSILNACGLGCSGAVGLCQAGSTCRYIDGPNCDNNPDASHPTNTICVPNNYPSLVTQNCTARDQGNSYVTVNGSNPTQTQLSQFCNPIITCYKCANATTNSCSPLTVNGSTCPSGSSSDPNGCGAASAGGSCISQITCYGCTDSKSNACTAKMINASTCPSGMSTDPNGCAATSAAGSCINQITCYKCTPIQTSGSQCDSFSATGSSCPSGSSTDPNGCAALARSGSCPVQQPIQQEPVPQQPVALISKPLPSTAIVSDKADPILLGILFILIGILTFKYNIIERIMNSDFKFIFTPFSLTLKEEKLKRKIIVDRKEFENKFKKEET